MRAFLAAAVATALLGCGTTASATRTPSSDTPAPKTRDQAELEALIQRLASADIAEREAAGNALVERGQSARLLLDRAARGPDAEVAARARAILTRLDHHIDATKSVLEGIWNAPDTSLHRKLRDSTSAFESECQEQDPAVIAKSLERQGLRILDGGKTEGGEWSEFLAKAGAYVSPGGIRHDLVLGVSRKPQASKTETTQWVLWGKSVVLVAKPNVEVASIIANPYPEGTVFRLAFDHPVTGASMAKYPIVDELELSYGPWGSHHDDELPWRFHVRLDLTNRERTGGVGVSFTAVSGLDPPVSRSGEKLDAGFTAQDTIKGFDGGQGSAWGSAVDIQHESHTLRRVEEKESESKPEADKARIVYGAGDLKALPEDTPTVTIRGDSFEAEDCEALARLSKLRALEWWYKKPVSGRAIELLAALKSLESLDFIGWGSVTDADLARLARLPRLKHLSLSDTQEVTDAGVTHLAGMKELTELHLHWCTGLTDAAVKSIAALGNLETLRLWGSKNLTDSGLEQISRLTKLKSLTLSHSKSFTAGGWNHLGNLKELREITLGFLSMDDKGLAALGTLPMLEEIGLDGVKEVTDAGLLDLRELKRLKRLSLSDCTGVTVEGIKRLQAALPGKYEVK